MEHFSINDLEGDEEFSVPVITKIQLITHANMHLLNLCKKLNGKK